MAAMQFNTNRRSMCFALRFTPHYTEMTWQTRTKGPIKTVVKTKQDYTHEEHAGFGTDHLLV